MRASHPGIDIDHRGRRVARMSFEQRAQLRKRYIAGAAKWRHPLIGYFLCFPLVGGFLWFALMLREQWEHFYFPASILTLPVLFVALFWGVGPSLLTVLLSTLAVDYFFISPNSRFSFDSWSGVLQMLPYVFAGLIIAFITAQRESERLKALAAEQALHDRAQELELVNRKLEDADQMKDRFISIASHELKTPITTIRGQAQLALRRLTKEQNTASLLEETSVALEKINDQTGHLTTLVDELLDVSRIRTGHLDLQKSAFDLTILCKEVVEDQRILTGRAVSFDAPGSPVMLNIDKGRLSQVFVNLISNAVKYSPEGAPVEVSISQSRRDALVKIRDYGKGIPRDQRERIFETFYRAPEALASSKQGLGLGLAISKDIVVRHGGRIWCESSSGKGCTFCVELPIG